MKQLDKLTYKNRSITARLMLGSLLFFAAIQIYSLALQQILAVIVIILGIIQGFRLLGRNENRIVRQIGIAFLLFIILRMVSVLYSPNREDGINELQFPIMALVFIALADWRSYLNIKDVRNFNAVWFIAAVLAAVIAIVKYTYGLEARIGPPFGPIIVQSDGLIQGNYATFSKFLTITILYFGMGWLIQSSLKSVYIRLFGLVILGVGLLLTFSRSCWLAVTLVLTVMLLKRRPKLIGLIISVVIAVILIIPSGRDRIAQSLSPGEWSSGRVELWRVAFEHSGDHIIFGHGLGSFGTLVTPEVRSKLPDTGVGDWHNQFLQIFMENGLIGLLVFIWLIFAFFIGCAEMLKKTSNPEARNAALGGIALLSSFIVISLFDNTLNSPHVNISFWCLMGLTVGWMRYESWN